MQFSYLKKILFFFPTESMGDNIVREKNLVRFKDMAQSSSEK